MTPLLEQFLSEARDFLQGIGEKLLQLEDRPDDNSIMGELFRLVHTLKGNSGLFEFPEMTRVLHVAEDFNGCGARPTSALFRPISRSIARSDGFRQRTVR